MFVQCLSNVKQAVDGHNKTKLSQTNTSDENTCNCRNKKRCPMNGKCLVKSPVYQATVTTDDNRPSQTYVGLTENTFKTRFNNHKASFKKRCPMNGKCLVKSPVYQATVTTDDNRPSQTYVGFTENTFKTRFNNHKASLHILNMPRTIMVC